MSVGFARIVVLVAGAVILVVETLATRLVAPYVGLTLESTTAVIGVALAGIAAGAALGGRWADSRPPRTVAAAALAAGGLGVLAVRPPRQHIDGSGGRSGRGGPRIPRARRRRDRRDRRPGGRRAAHVAQPCRLLRRPRRGRRVRRALGTVAPRDDGVRRRRPARAATRRCIPAERDRQRSAGAGRHAGRDARRALRARRGTCPAGSARAGRRRQLRAGGGGPPARPSPRCRNGWPGSASPRRCWTRRRREPWPATPGHWWTTTRRRTS